LTGQTRSVIRATASRLKSALNLPEFIMASLPQNQGRRRL
jgi:hypothetical protein